MTQQEKHVGTFAYWAAIFFIFAHFATGSTLFSKDKGFWDDETYGMSFTAQHSSGDMLLHGAAGQGNPAPLYFLLLKACAPVFQGLQKLSIPKTVYERWLSLGSLLACCFLFLYHRPSSIDRVSAIFIVLFALYSEMGFYYSSEARPYALWMGGSLVLLTGILSLYRSRLWILFCILLGATSIAAFFQFAAIAVALVMGGLLLQRPIYCQWKIWFPLASGSCAAFYYSLHCIPLGFTSDVWGTWSMFFLLFTTYKWVMISACLVIEQAYSERNFERLCLYLAILCWFIMGPLIYEMTRMKHNFFTPRQYIYWTPATAFVIVGLAQDLLRRLKPDMTSRRWASWGLAFMLLYFCIRPTHVIQTIPQVNSLTLSVLKNIMPRIFS